MRVQLAATLEVRATFEVEPGAWPEEWTPREISTAVETTYRDDPAALLEAFAPVGVLVRVSPA